MRMAGHEARPGRSEPRYSSGRTASVRRSTSGGIAYRFLFSCGDRNYKYTSQGRTFREPRLRRTLCRCARISIIFAGATVTQ